MTFKQALIKALLFLPLINIFTVIFSSHMEGKDYWISQAIQTESTGASEGTASCKLQEGVSDECDNPGEGDGVIFVE